MHAHNRLLHPDQQVSLFSSPDPRSECVFVIRSVRNASASRRVRLLWEVMRMSVGPAFHSDRGFTHVFLYMCERISDHCAVTRGYGLPAGAY